MKTFLLWEIVQINVADKDPVYLLSQEYSDDDTKEKEIKKISDKHNRQTCHESWDNLSYLYVTTIITRLKWIVKV